MKKLVIVRGTPLHRAIVFGAGAVLAVFLFIIPQTYAPYQVGRLTTAIVYAIAVLGLNLLVGYSGQISLGHSFFFAVGAYIYAILVVDHGWPYLATLPVAFVVTFILGFIAGIPALRLEGLYLALITLGLAVVTPNLIKKFDTQTRGSQGIIVPKPDAPSWTGLAGDQWRYYVCLVVAVLFFWAAHNLMKGRVGRALLSVRDNELVARTMGVNLGLYKTGVFALSAAYAGVAGALFVMVFGIAAPGSFEAAFAISLLSAMVIGGLARISGAIFGALFIQYVPVYTSDINKALSGVIYGAALVVFMFVMPGGAVALLRKIRDLFVSMRYPPAKPGEAPIEVVAPPPLSGTDVAVPAADDNEPETATVPDVEAVGAAGRAEGTTAQGPTRGPGGAT